MSIRLFRMYVKVPIVLLALVEGSLLVFIPYLAAALRFDGLGPSESTPTGNLLPTAVVFAVLGLVSLFAFGLYSTRQRMGFGGLVVRVLAAVANAAALSTIAYYLFPSIAIGRGLLAITAGIAVVSLIATRLLFERIVDQDLFRRRVLVYGAGRRAESLLQLRRRSDTRGFRILGLIATEGDTVSAPADRLMTCPPDLFRWCVDHEVDEIVVAMDDRRVAFPMHEFLECRLSGIEIVELPTFLERETGKVRLDVLNPSWIIFGEGFRASPVQRALERGFDVIASSALLILASPFMLLAVVAIKLEDGLQAPVLYRQRRVGRYSECFDVLKFRSMSVDAETNGAVWAVKDDPRVTHVGACMRKTRIDELPQLFNVLRGDMSFVGPRPERPEFVEQLEQKIPYYRERHTVKPGITGWAQLCYPYGSSEKDALEKLQYDLYYVKNRSLLFDLAILVQTVEVVLWGKGAR
ncbi:MAG: TIGR03013 family PEP-CTERM/XrtA system glycosyltransferase [Burkholderiales bacterium]|nr:TIGR03013 family PEP-CTERM/XrtA system glycosyltransferase [Burkholderiales bacterium]